MKQIFFQLSRRYLICIVIGMLFSTTYGQIYPVQLDLSNVNLDCYNSSVDLAVVTLNKLKAYPNPNPGFLHLRGNINECLLSALRIELKDLTGKTILTRKIEIQSGYVDYDLQLPFPAGLYIMYCRTETFAQIIPVIIQF